MKLFNSLTMQKEEFISQVPGKVSMYSCGPTVYNLFHIGNARPFITFDVLRRYLENKGYDVTFVQNFTDVDDKLIASAAQSELSVLELAEKYIKEYFIDAHGLGIKNATHHPRATENIDAIIKMIATLVDKGYAYVVDGDVYYSTKKFQDYGKLSHQPLENLEAGARIAPDENKVDVMDFALWKRQKPGEIYWDSPWGHGRPGWHIECSAMANRFLGETIDIHAGGKDLIFPHHENEIAQSQAANGCVFANYWLHNGYINIDDKKMSKSLGNMLTVRELAQEYGYQTLRFFMLSSHYRSPINFSRELMVSSKQSLERILNCIENVDFYLTLDNKNREDINNQINAQMEKFIEEMEDDINTAGAIGALFETVRLVNSWVDKMSTRGLEKAKIILLDMCGMLGISVRQDHIADQEILDLIEERSLARKEKNFKKSDEIRDYLKSKGIVLEDTKDGTKYSYAQ